MAEFKDENIKVLKEHQKALESMQKIREKLSELTSKRLEVPDIEKLKKTFADLKSIQEVEGDIANLRSLMTYGFKRVQEMESKMFVEKETYEMIRQMIKKYIDRGYTKKQIVGAFQMQGWPKSLIRQYIEA